jgi:rare lipoprotein A
LPSYAEVTDLKTGRTILVRVERRGPGDSQHAIELSPGAAAQLGIAAGSNEGVRVRRVNPPEQDRALLRSGNPAPERMATPKPLLDVLQRKLDPALAQKALDAEDRDPVPPSPPAW